MLILQIVRPERCRHCKLCEKCRLNIDHHCLFLLGCIAKNNHRQFILLIFTVLLAQVMFLIHATRWLIVIYPHGTWWDLAQLACQFQCWVLALMLLNFLSIIWGVNLLKYQLNVVSYGITTIWAPRSKGCSHTGGHMKWSHRLKNVQNFFAGKRTYTASEMFGSHSI